MATTVHRSQIQAKNALHKLGEKTREPRLIGMSSNAVLPHLFANMVTTSIDIQNRQRGSTVQIE